MESSGVDNHGQRVVDLALLHARLNGVGLEGETKTRLNDLKVRLAELVRRGSRLLQRMGVALT